jgi:zinc protease
MTAVPLSLNFQRHQLENGLRVILHTDPAIPLVAVNLWYYVGSRNERPGRTGFAHLFEHMLFQGSEHVGTNDHFHYIQQVGGVANGSTWFDRTNYYETLPSHHLDLGLWLESDRMGFLLPALTSEKLETQRQVVMNERRQRVENQPYGQAMERLHELLYPSDHPYHWPVIGYMDDIAAAQLDEVKAFFRTYYSPSNAVLTLAGDIDPDHALERVAAYFGDIPSGPPIPSLPANIKSPAPITDAPRVVLEEEVPLPRVYLGFRAPSYGQPQWYAGDLLATLLSGGKSSLLYRDLVYDRQIAQDVVAYLQPFEAVSTFTVLATARPGVDIAEVEAAITGHLRELGRAPANEKDLESARARTLTSLFSGLQKLDNRADLFSQFTTFFDDPAGVVDEPQRYARLGAEDLREFAATCLSPEKSVTVTVVPKAA